VNEPKTMTTGFSLSRSARLTVFPPMSFSVKLTAVSPTARPALSKPPEDPLRSQLLVRAFDSTSSSGCSLLGVVDNLDSSSSSLGGASVGVEVGVQAAIKLQGPADPELSLPIVAWL
jgi:hypothetical protein